MRADARIFCLSSPDRSWIIQCNRTPEQEAAYPNADYPQIWEAYEAVAALWRITGLFISERCGFEYPGKTEQDMTAFVHCLKEQKQTEISRKE